MRKLSSTFLSPLPIFSWRFHATINLYSTYIPTSDSPSTTRAVADIPSITSAVGHVRCNDISGCKLGFKSTNLNFVRNIFFGPQGCQCTYIDEDNGFVQLQPRVGRVMMAFTSAAVEIVWGEWWFSNRHPWQNMPFTRCLRLDVPGLRPLTLAHYNLLSFDHIDIFFTPFTLARCFFVGFCPF